MSRKKSTESPTEPKLSKFDRERMEQGLPPESKADKFVRLGMKRIPKARNAIRQVAQLANKSTYEWTPKQCDDIISALQAAVKHVVDRFKGSTEDGELFRL